MPFSIEIKRIDVWEVDEVKSSKIGERLETPDEIRDRCRYDSRPGDEKPKTKEVFGPVKTGNKERRSSEVVVLEQNVEKLDLVAVIKAINGIG